MDYITRPASRKQIRQLSKIFRWIFGVDDDEPFPVLQALEELPDVIEGTGVCIVEDKYLPSNIAARCYPDEKNNFTIEIKNSVYLGAYKKNVGAYLSHILHEMCHVFLFKIGYVPLMNRSFENREIRPFESVEWQAKALCGEVLMPYEATMGMTSDEIVKKYHVSKQSADYRLKLD